MADDTPTASLEALIAARFAPPAWACFFEVPPATGGPGDRRADAVAMSLWPSKGLELHGFEIKRSRADWLRELKDPHKSDRVGRYCDRFWLVVEDAKIVQPGELPGGWGLFCRRGDSLVAKVDAPRLEAAEIGRPFLAALCRCAHETLAREMAKAEAPSKEALLAEYNKGVARGEEFAKVDVDRLKRELARVNATVDAFAKASGVNIEANWRGPAHAGRIFRLLLDHQPDQLMAILENHADALRRAAEATDERIVKIREAING